MVHKGANRIVRIVDFDIEPFELGLDWIADIGIRVFEYVFRVLKGLNAGAETGKDIHRVFACVPPNEPIVVQVQVGSDGRHRRDRNLRIAYEHFYGCIGAVIVLGFQEAHRKDVFERLGELHHKFIG